MPQPPEASLAPGWYCLPRLDPDGGPSVIPICIDDTQGVFWRTADETAAATHRYCPHRGADLARGSVVSEGLRCEYHGWCWGPDGRLASLPGEELPPPFTTTRWPTARQGDRDWLWMGPANSDPDPLISLAEAFLPAEVKPLGLIDHGEALAPVALGENAFDLSHFAALHELEAPRITRMELGNNPAMVEYVQDSTGVTSTLFLYSTSQVLSHYRGTSFDFWTHSYLVLGERAEYEMQGYATSVDPDLIRFAKGWGRDHRRAVMEDLAIQAARRPEFGVLWGPHDDATRAFYHWIAALRSREIPCRTAPPWGD